MTTPAGRRLESLFVEHIEVGERHRALDAGAVERLAASMDTLGLRTPISVRYYEDRPEWASEGEAGDTLILITGAHRLAAAKRLGWERIDCYVYDDGDRIDAEMWEIAENLHRLDLTKDERDRQIRRYAELLKQREIPSAQDAPVEIGYGRPPPRPKGIASKIADDTGLSKDTVKRALTDTPERKAMRAEQQRARDADIRDQRTDAERQVASLLADHIPAEHWDGLKASLHAAGCKRLAEEFQRLVGVSVFDNTAAGRRDAA